MISPQTPGKTPPPAEAPRCLDSKALFQQDRTVQIEHDGQRYLLRITRENKLILTK